MRRIHYECLLSQWQTFQGDLRLSCHCDLARYHGLGLPRLHPSLPCSLAEAVGRGLAAQHCPDRPIVIPWSSRKHGNPHPCWHPGTVPPERACCSPAWQHGCGDLSHHISTCPQNLPLCLVKPQPQLSPTQLLIPSPLPGWMRDSEKQK